MKKNGYTLALLSLLALYSCGDLPQGDHEPEPGVTFHALLETGRCGWQPLLLTRTLDNSEEPTLANASLPGAVIRLSNQRGLEIRAQEDPQGQGYGFDRADFPLLPYDTVRVEVAGRWGELDYWAAGSTILVNDEGLAFSRKPGEYSAELDADTLLLHDEEADLYFSDLTAFTLDWSDLHDGRDYSYQLDFVSVVRQEGGFVPTPYDRLQWLRDDAEKSWQWGTTPDMRFPPLEYGGPVQVPWGAFVFVDAESRWTLPDGSQRALGYYEIALRRMNRDTADFFYSTHNWLRDYAYDPVDFNMSGEHVLGFLGSNARTSFRVAIVEDGE